MSTSETDRAAVAGLKELKYLGDTTGDVLSDFAVLPNQQSVGRVIEDPSNPEPDRYTTWLNAGMEF